MRFPSRITFAVLLGVATLTKQPHRRQFQRRKYRAAGNHDLPRQMAERLQARSETELVK